MQQKWFGPVLFIPGANRGRYPYCNSLYIKGPDALIDPGSDRDLLARLAEQVPVKQVWLSHYHEDHIAHLDLFDHLPLWISQQDALPLTSVKSFMDWEWFESSDAQKKSWLDALTQTFHFKPRIPTGYLTGGNRVKTGALTVEIIACPGHTAGSVAFYLPEPSILFVGDYDLTPFGPYYGDRGSSIPETIASIERLRKIPAKTVIGSHEVGIFENPNDAIWERYLEVIATREAKLLRFLDQPRSLEEIVRESIVYGKTRKTRSYFELGERSLMKKHLEHLLSKNVIRVSDGYYIKC